MAATRPVREKPPATWDLVLKRNPVERIKQEKAPLGIRDELPALIATGYEEIPEEDIVRLKWWGLYHDKPKIGTFMLRVKTPGGIVSPTQLRAIGELSNDFGRGDAGGGRGGGVLLRQPRLLGSAAQAQDRDHRVRRQLRRAGDQLHRPDRR